MIYLASPLTHDDPAVFAYRVEAVRRATAWYMARGIQVFSPINNCADLLPYCGLSEKSHDWWMQYNLSWLGCASELVVLTLPGWEESIGCQQEIRYMERLGKPVSYISMEAIEEGQS